MTTVRAVLVALLACAAWAVPAAAATAPTDRWLPNPPGATWVYGWSDNEFSNVTTFERYTVAERGDAFVQLQWSTEGENTDPGAIQSAGLIDYRYTSAGLINTNWSSTPPPPQFPVLCPNPTGCGNSLAGAHYQLIWGSRTPLLQEPLVRGAEWESLGGQNSDVASRSRYMGRERVVVPAFPAGVLAAKVETEITQAGSVDDEYGSGVRTTWWVFGVGPVKSVFRHSSGAQSFVDLHATSLGAKALPTDVALLPFRRGQIARFRWTNSRHMRRASVQDVAVTAVERNSARMDVREVSGPITVQGTYVFSSGREGVRNLTVSARSAVRASLPSTGPRGRPSSRRRKLRTPIDLMIHGFNPVVTAYPVKGTAWEPEAGGADRRIYGVTGKSTALGFQRVKTPAGRYTAFAVRSTLKQPGFPFGSGVRTMWFAPGVGLVKLVFKHGDGSVSTVQRMPR